jgi:Protein of unknown function (DUF992)
MMRFVLACICMMGWAAASAQTARSNLGTLTCTLSQEAEKQTAPAGEERLMRCAFKPAGNGAEQTYTGSIRRVGQTETPSGRLVMIWVVQGPTEIELEPGLLAQTYVGSPDRGQSPTGGGMLIGERNRDISLRTETSPEAPAGLVVTVLELKVLSVPA